MAMAKWIKRFMINSAVVVTSFLVAFLFLNLIANITLPRLIQQDLYPRGMINSIGISYHTFYATTYDKSPEKWQAVLGDSHAAGLGDAFLDGEKDYSVAHLLREKDANSYFIFGRSGYGSLSSTREFLLTMQESKSSMFMPKLTTPEKFVFLFYEGNDLDDNLRRLQGAAIGPDGIRGFVRDALNQPPDLARRIDYYLPLTRFMFSLATHKTLSAPLRRWIRKKNEKPKATVNSMEVMGTLTGIGMPLQAASLELTPKESSDTLTVFFECLQYLKEIYPNTKMEIVYIPSLATVYPWREPITLQVYHPGRGKASASNDENAARSLWIREQIAAHAGAHGYGFIDVTESMKASAESTVLHGPKDWKHPNRLGYQIVRDAILTARGHPGFRVSDRGWSR